MLRALAFLILRNSYGRRFPAPLFAVLWARAYLSRGEILPRCLPAPRRRRPF